jgi:hypothetical protein
MNIETILDYEVRSSFWACYVSSRRLQGLASRYFAWKAKRKYSRYKKSLATQEVLRKVASN